MNIDHTWLVHTLFISKVNGVDSWGKTVYGPKMEHSKVRVNPTRSYRGSGDGRSLETTAKIYMYKAYTTNFPKLDDSYLNAIVYFEDKEMIIKTIASYCAVDSNKTFSYEIGVI